MSTPVIAAPAHRLRAVLLFAGVLLIAFNLRPALTSVSPVLVQIGSAMGFGVVGLSLLTTIPVACFAVLAPVSLPLQRRLGLEAAMLAAMLALVAGLALRMIDDEAALFIGTALAGSGIAVGNVLLPAIVKRDFAGRVGTVTGLYTTLLNGGAAIASGISVPLAHASGLGWRAALGFWALPAAAAALLWWPQIGHGAGRTTLPQVAGGFRRLLKMKLAWAVALFMGLQSLGFYAMISWLPAMLHAVGITPARAGLMLSMFTVIAIPASLVTPGLAARCRDQRALVAATLGFTGIGFAGLAFAPGAAPWLWVVIVGLGQGALFPLALTLIVLRAAGPAEAMALSAFSQTIGYAVSIAGPLGMGMIHAATGTWFAPVLFLIATLVPALGFGLAAARARVVRL